MIATASPCKEAPATPKPQTACSCCGGLECIEKPRFFAGQLLTDLDLQAAMNYVSAKSRLHNRYLFGAGVVCGLTVHCDPCSDTKVIVDPGYALDCLGNDIVVCSPATFDVKEALDCLKKKHEPDCGGTPKNRDCEPPEAEYCLVISYDEQHLNPVNALIRDQGCRSNRCEPSRTKESWRLQLIDEATAKTLNVRPTVWSRIEECEAEYRKLEAFHEELRTIDKLPLEQRVQALENVTKRIRAAILEFAKKHTLTRCDLLDRICELDKLKPAPPPPPTPTPGIGQIPDTSPAPPLQDPPATRPLLMLYMQLVTDCICNALLMPCEECCEPEVVLLACLTIRDGKVVRICNTVRTQVISGLSVRYWLQPVFDVIKSVLEKVCCGDLREYFPAEASFSATAGKMRQARNVTGTVGRFSSALVEHLDQLLHVPLEESNIPAPIDLYNRPVAEVQARLNNAKIETKVTMVTHEQAHRLRNLGGLGLRLQEFSILELIVAPDGLVTGLRHLGEAQ